MLETLIFVCGFVTGVIVTIMAALMAALKNDDEYLDRMPGEKRDR